MAMALPAELGKAMAPVNQVAELGKATAPVNQAAEAAARETVVVTTVNSVAVKMEAMAEARGKSAAGEACHSSSCCRHL